MDESVLHGIFWNHLVYPELASDEVEDPGIIHTWISEHLPANQWPEYVACLAVDDLAPLQPAGRREMIQRIREVISQTLPEQQYALLGFAHTNAVYFCGQQIDTEELLHSRLNKLNQRIVSELRLSNTLGIAYVLEDTLAGLQWAAQCAVVAQRQKVRTGTNRVYVYSESTPATSLDLAKYLEFAQRMHMVIKSGDSNATALILDELVRTLFQQVYLPLHHLRPIVQCRVIFMAQAAMDGGVDAEVTARQSEQYRAQIGITFDYTSLREILIAAAMCFTQLVQQRFRNLTHRLVAAVEEYITLHLADQELSLQDISAHLGASPTHISRTFKKIKGMALTRYINQQRVDAAKRQLLDGDVSVTTLAFQLGFGSLQHFGRVFKEVTGTTPTAYRHTNIE